MKAFTSVEFVDINNKIYYNISIFLKGDKNMKKKMFALAILLVAVLAIASCNNTAAKQYNVTFDSKGGTAVAYKSVVENKTFKAPSDPTYVENGTIREFLGWYLGDTKYNFDTPVTADITLTAKWGEAKLYLAGGKSGQLFNFKYMDAEYRNNLTATLERWLIDKGISIPLFYSSSLVMYNERITTASPTYVANMGYGATYGSFTGVDNYTSTTTSFAETLNRYDYRDSSASDVLSMVEGGIYAFDWNQDFTGYKAIPELAESYPIPVAKNAEGKWVETLSEEEATYESLSRSWKVVLRDDIKWNDGSDITLADFVDNIKIILDPANAYYRANSYFSGGFFVVNAKQYNEGECDWDKVGITVLEEENAIVYTLTQELAQIDFMYNTSSFLFGPIDKEFYDSCVDGDGKCTYGAIPTSGTEVTTLKYSGEFTIEYYEDDKEIRYAKNPYYVANPERAHGTVFSHFTVKMVASSEAAWELFLAGEVDVAAVPAAKYANYKDDPRAKTSPDATVKRLSVNQASDEEVDAVTGGAWKGNALMQNQNFLWALYFGVDRVKLAKEIIVNAEPCQYYVNTAYLTAVQASTPYRTTEAGQNVAGDRYSASGIDLLEATCGYSAEDALEFYVAALDELVAAGKVSASEPVTLSVELNIWPDTSVVYQNVSHFIANGYETIFNSQTKYPNITFDMTELLSNASISYYQKQMLCKFDLAIGGISGSTLDVLSLFDVWSSSDSNGLKISWGVDTVNVIESNLILWEGAWWTYDALVAAASAPTWIVDGVISTEYSAAVSEVTTKIGALYEYVAAEKELTGDALDAWTLAKDQALEKLNEALSPAGAYAELSDYIAVCEDKLNKVLLANELGNIYTLFTLQALKDIVAKYAAEGIYDWLVENGYADSYGAQVAELLGDAESALAKYEEQGYSEANAKALSDAYNALADWYASVWA